MKVLLFAILPLIGVPVLADKPQSAAPESPPLLTAAQLQAILSCPAPRRASDSEDSEGSTLQADCTARCLDGSVRFCSGSSCQAADSYCSPSLQQGYCWSDVEGYKFCNDTGDRCPDPCLNKSPLCRDIHGTYCKYSGITCYDELAECIPTTCNCVQGTYRCLY
jgi:hypothetical protein